MTIWHPDIEGRPGPRYLAIADAIGEAVADGRLSPGARLPTHRELAYRLGCTVGTISRAYAEAERRGLVRGEVGRGTFVAGGRESGSAARSPLDFAPGADGLINLATNYPAPVDYAAAAAPVLGGLAGRRDIDRLFVYRHDDGLPEHRAAGAQWIERRGIPATAARVAITAGAQHGFVAALMAFARPGDVLLSEALTYPGVMAAALGLGLRLQGVAMDEHGLRPDALDEAAQRTGARVLLTVPTLHNPTATVMPAGRRAEIVEVARARDLHVIEDDVYGFLLEDGPPAIAALAPERCTYVTSLSKSVAPGLRIGFVLPPEAGFAAVAAAVRAGLLMIPPLTAEIATAWIGDGTAARMAAARRRETRARQEIARRILARWTLQGDPAGAHVFLHLPEPWRPGAFVAEARSRGVAVTGAEAFAVSRSSVPPAVRLCLSAPPDRALVARGLEVLAEILSGAVPSGLAVI